MGNHKLVHYSIDKHDLLRPLSYEELIKDRARGSWEGRDDLAKKYVADRKRFESELHRRLLSRGLPTDRNNSFLYATIDGHEQFGKPDYYRHEMPLTDDVINTSFFDVVGDGKSRTTIGRRGLANALRRWADAHKNNTLSTSEYMGLYIKPRVEVITPASLTPINTIKTSTDRVRVVMPYKGQYLMETMMNPKWPQNLGKRRFVGGGIDEGETPQQAAARELMEELGIRAAEGQFKYLGLDPKETSHKLHYLQLDKHGLKPGKYKATVGSDPYIHLNKGMPAGDDYTGADLMSLLKASADFNIPSKTDLDSSPLKPTPAPLKPPVAKAPAMPLQAKPVNTQYDTRIPASPMARPISSMNVPGGYYNAGTQATATPAAEYGAGPQQNAQAASVRNKVMEDWLNSNYSNANTGAFGPNRLAAHQAISGNIQRLPEYYSNTKALAEMARDRRMATPHVMQAPSQSVSTNQGSYGDVTADDSTVRKMYVTPQEHRVNDERPVGWNQNITEIHEREHAGAQKVDPNADNLTNTFQFETPAVLSELANSAQAAYDAGSGKPLQGNFTITPNSAKPINVPLETLRQQAYRRGHTGGQGNVSMTEMLNSPEGQEFIRMNLRRAEFAERERMKQQAGN
jgi:ADP-ribose pyrophosphatase YjhB (NUDIX family)